MVHEGTRRRLPRAEAIGRSTKPYKARADFAGAEAVLTSLSSLQMQKIVSNAVSNDAKDLAKYGLDKPDATVTVIAGSTRASIAIGKTEGDAVYARDVSRPIVFTIPATAAADLEKDAEDAPAQGPVRRAVVQHDARRAATRRRDVDVRASRRARTARTSGRTPPARRSTPRRSKTC